MPQPYKTIALTQGKTAIVNASDYAFLMQWKWCAHYDPVGRKWYAVRTQRHDNGCYTFYMHRVIMGAPKGIGVDHIDGDGFNNIRDNLRFANQTQNGHNRGPQRNNKSGKKGVSLFKRDGTWKAQIRINGKNKHIGYFKDINDAHNAYAKMSKEYHGEFSRIT